MTVSLPPSSQPAPPGPNRLQRLSGYLSRDPDNASLMAEVFDLALAEGQLDRAEELWRHALALGHEPWRWGINGVHLNLARHEWDAAEQGIAFLEAEPSCPAAGRRVLAHDRAYVLLRRGRYAEACDVLQRLFEAGAAAGVALPATTESLAVRAWHHAGRLDEGVAWLRARRATGACDAELAGLGSLLAMDAGDFELAASLCADARTAGHRNVEAWVTESAIALARQDLPAAESYANQALALRPGEGRALLALGLAQMAAGRAAEARQTIEQTALAMPFHVGTWIALGWLRIATGDVPAAEDAFRRGTELDRNFAECWGGLASAQALQGRREDALDSLARAERLDRANLASLYARQVLDGTPMDGAAMAATARRVLARKPAPFGGTMADWLPPV